jgi:hypothetical protein
VNAERDSLVSRLFRELDHATRCADTLKTLAEAAKSFTSAEKLVTARPIVQAAIGDADLARYFLRDALKVLDALDELDDASDARNDAARGGA